MSTGRVVALSAAGIIAVAAAVIAPWEGRRLTPYKDIVGIATVCYGHTGNVQARKYTPAECDALLASDIAEHWAGVSKCIARPVTDNQGAAILSLAFNVGVSAVCRSTLIRKLNAGEPASVWCRELLRWNKAGGREVRGLTNRRKAELKLCLTP